MHSPKTSSQTSISFWQAFSSSAPGPMTGLYCFGLAKHPLQFCSTSTTVPPFSYHCKTVCFSILRAAFILLLMESVLCGISLLLLKTTEKATTKILLGTWGGGIYGISQFEPHHEPPRLRDSISQGHPPSFLASTSLLMKCGKMVNLRDYASHHCPTPPTFSEDRGEWS